MCESILRKLHRVVIMFKLHLLFIDTSISFTLPPVTMSMSVSLSAHIS